MIQRSSSIVLSILALFALCVAIMPSAHSQGKAATIDATVDHLVVEYFPIPHSWKSVSLNGQQYVNFPDAEAAPGTSAPLSGLPVETFLVGIPPEGNPDIEVVNFTSSTQPRVLLSRSSVIGVKQGTVPEVERSFVPVTEPSLNGGGSTPGPRVVIGRIFSFRYQRIAVVEINPYHYDPGTGVLTTFTSVRLRFRFPQLSAGRSVPDRQFESSYKSLLINYEQARQWRTIGRLPSQNASIKKSLSAPGLNYGWFNPGQQYYRTNVGTDGVYRLTYSNIQQLGLIPENIDMGRIEVYYKGISLRLRSVGDADGQFNPNDFIEFFGSKLYDSPGVANEYSDTSVYWLTFQGQGGPRSATDSILAGSPQVIADYFNATVRAERDSFYYFGDQGLPNNNQTAKLPGESWYWGTIYGGQNVSFPVPLDNVYTTGNPSFQLAVKVHSSVFNQATPNHTIEVIVNGTSLGTNSLGGYEDKTILVSGPVSLLVQGNNVVTLSSKQTNASLNQVLIDWLEFRVPHLFHARNDSLMFLPDRIVPGQIASFQLDGFSAGDISVYRVDTLGDIEKTLRGVVSQASGVYSITFTDTVTAQRKYIAVTGSRKLQIPPFIPKTFVNLRSPSQGSDYLVITAPEFATDANRLASYRGQRGIGRTKVVPVTDIYDEFGFGFFDPMAIRRFLQAADTLWAAPKPAYVVLFGDANWDYKNISATSRTNFVPSIGNPVSDEFFVSSATDSFLPTKFVGRIPCVSQAEAAATVDRIINYESTPPDLWNKRYMFLVGGFDSVETKRFSDFSDILISQNITPSPLSGLPSRLYRTISQVIEFEQTEEAKRIISNGAVWINYYGHGGTDLWGNGITSPSQLQNAEGKRHLISDISCSTARFAEPTIESFAEQMFFGDQGGAIAYLGSSGFGFESPLQIMARSLYHQVAVDSIRELGRLLLGAKISLWSGGTGSIITQEALQQYTLIGDPALRIDIPEVPDYAASSNQISSNPTLPSDSDSTIVVSTVLSNFGLRGKDSVEVRVDHQYQNLSETILDRRIPSIASLDTLSFTSSSFSRGGVHQITVRIDPSNTITEVTKSNNTADFSLFVNSGSILPILPLPSSTIHPDSVVLVLQDPGNSAQQSWQLAVEVDTSSLFLTSTRVQLQNVPQSVLSTKAQIPSGMLRDTTLYYWRGRFIGTEGFTNWVGGYFLTSKSLRSSWIQDRQSLFAKNSSDGLATGSSVILDVHRSPVTAYSGGFSDGNNASISVDNVNVTQGFANRGYNVAVMNQYSGKLESFAAFSIYSDTGDTTLSKPLITFLNSIPAGRRVVIAIMDDGASGKSKGLNEAIEACGSALIRSLRFRASWALLGWKGAPIGSVPEGLKLTGSGPVTLSDTLTFQSVIGSMVTPLIGPSTKWNSITVAVDTSVPGTHCSIDLIRTRNSGLSDTLVNILPLQAPFSSLIPPGTASIRLRATLRSVTVGNTPIFSKWSLSFDPPPELAINNQTLSLSSNSLMEGFPVTAHVQVYNIGAGRADSIVVISSMVDLSRGTTTIDSAMIPSIVPGSFVSLDQQLSTANHVGANNILIQVDPHLVIPELYKSNNIFSLPLVVKADTVHPTFTITFDGNPIYDGAYVSPNPTIVIDVSDNNPLPITNPSSVILLLDNQQVTLGNSPDSLFEPRNGPDKAIVTYRPRLNKGDHNLSVQVKDAAGNPADTSARQLNFRVETEAGLLNVVNYPNPFARQTQFTFILVGSTLPEDLRIKIYSVAGRLIQEIKVWGADLRFGFNRVPWDGRDREGDEMANGIYFYKIVMNVGGKSVEAIQKLAKVR